VKSSRLRRAHNGPYVRQDAPETRFAQSYVKVSPAENSEVVSPTTNQMSKIDLTVEY